MRLIKHIEKEVLSGSVTGVLIAAVFVFLLVVGGTFVVKKIGSNNHQLCKYLGSFWVDDSVDPSREGDFKGCFTMREMYELGRL